MNANRTFQFSAAVRGYHVFQKTWQPTENETLNCFHDAGNKYDPFSIKTWQVDNCRKTVGHLPREFSRATKFLLDRGATVNAKLTTTHYRRSPLFQGGLEIPCIVTVSMPGTVRNHMVMDRYKEIVTGLYCEPKNEITIGSFLERADVVEAATGVQPNKKQKKTHTGKKEKPAPKSKDIRDLFRNNVQKRNKPGTIVID